MNTTKPISTISYNVVATDAKGRRSAPYLESKLNSLTSSGVLLFWCYIFHFAEDDECRKDHLHVYMEPAKKVDTVALASLFEEPDPSDPTKPPLGVMPIRNSKFEDWELYSTHDEDYLAFKGLKKKFHYKDEDVRTSSPDEFYRLCKMINKSAYQSDISAMLSAMAEGKSFIDYCKTGAVDLRRYIPASKLWKDLVDDENSKAKKEYEKKSEKKKRKVDLFEDYQIPPDACLVKSPRGSYTYSTLDGQTVIPRMCRAYIDPSCGLVYFCHNHSSDDLDKLAKSGCILDPPFVISSVNYEDPKEPEKGNFEEKMDRFVHQCLSDQKKV